MSAEIIEFTGDTTLDLPVERILNKAQAQGLAGVVVIGEDEDGEFYFSSSYSDGPEVLWLLEQAKFRLFQSAYVIPEVEDDV